MTQARVRLRALVIVLASSGIVLLALAMDVRARVQGSAEGRNAAIVRATGLPELALSTTSTWLRHPALAAPSAGASQAPLGLDVDPAGAVIPRRSRERTITIERVP